MVPHINNSDIIDICLQAGKAIMKVYQCEDFSKITDYKADNSPLTLADREAHNIITPALRAITPHIPIISEEGEQVAFEERKDWPLFWLVDPLDGTKEFIKRNGEFTVNIALIQNGKPVLGCIFQPINERLYFGSQTGGAFKMQDGVSSEIKASGRKERLIATGSKSHASEKEKEVLKKFDIKEVISVGSSLKFCMVAEGTADVYYREGPTMEWDTAAGQAILEAAGGRVLDVDGKQFLYNKSSLLNGSFICLGPGVRPDFKY